MHCWKFFGLHAKWNSLLSGENVICRKAEVKFNNNNIPYLSTFDSFARIREKWKIKYGSVLAALLLPFFSSTSKSSLFSVCVDGFFFRRIFCHNFWPDTQRGFYAMRDYA